MPLNHPRPAFMYSSGVECLSTHEPSRDGAGHDPGIQRCPGYEPSRQTLSAFPRNTVALPTAAEEFIAASPPSSCITISGTLRTDWERCSPAGWKRGFPDTSMAGKRRRSKTVCPYSIPARRTALKQCAEKYDPHPLLNGKRSLPEYPFPKHPLQDRSFLTRTVFLSENTILHDEG